MAENIEALAKELTEKLEKFHDMLPPTQEQLETFAKTTLELDELARKALPAAQNPTSRLMEEVQNAANTAETILNQPLEVAGATPGTSLVAAAKRYAQERETMDLSRITQTFTRYTDQTESLKVELQLTINDLKAA